MISVANAVRGGRHRLGLGRVVQQSEDDGRQGDGENHHDGAAHSGRDDAPEDDQPPGDYELDDRGDENESGEGGRSAVRHGGDAERNGEGGGEHGQHGAGAGRAEPTDLEDGGEAANQERGEDHPDEVGLIAAGGIGHDDGGDEEGGGGDEAELQAVPQRGQEGRVFVRLVAGGSEAVPLPESPPAAALQRWADLDGRADGR